MPIIDSHIHHFPEDLVKDPLAWVDRHSEHVFKKMIAPGSIQGYASTDQLLRDMDAAGVEKVVILGMYWLEQSTCDEHNAFQSKCIKAHPDRFIAFASVQPLAGDKAIEGVKRAIDQGHKGIGEMFHKVQGFEMSNPTWCAILQWAEENKLPVNFHVTDPVGADYLGKTLSPFEDFKWVAQKYPNLKIILAHLGGLLPFHELDPQFAKVAKNIYYDTAACPLMYNKRVYKMVIDAIGADRLLFGSDYPLRIYPGKQKQPGFEMFIKEMKGLGLVEEDLGKILSGNIARVLELTR